ncbi:hypothetical protein [Mycoplasma sp. 1018B]|uniref:hypothetical protein n=1 Tax=Mycoplasma sp. 1018B TaxID=2967302 RepID=UPI00211BB390|nr:hypothetical protein [Mycoplasma sp. 1018B]UUM18988.1 hypothetical protein NPA14_01455 [Mycoplasma sp. 1018B]
MNTQHLEPKTSLVLPVLKPINMKDKFLEKLGDKFKSNVIIIVAMEEKYAYFLSCLKETQKIIENEKIIPINIHEGTLENGNLKIIELANYIDISTIYRISVENIKYFAKSEYNDLPYLSIFDQMKIIELLTNNLSNKKNIDLIYIKKRNQNLNNSI